MTAAIATSEARSEPKTVFVSYSRDDRKAAQPVIELLEQAGFSVWWDGLLAGGERFSHTPKSRWKRHVPL